jgi:hypothetical protein
MGAELFHADGQTYRQQTDRHDEGKSDSSLLFERAAKNLYDSSVATCAFYPGFNGKAKKIKIKHGNET